MGKSFKARVREFFCCFHDEIEDVISPSPRPNSSDERIPNHSIEVEEKGEVKIRVGYRVVDKPKKVIEVFEAENENANIIEIIKDGHDGVVKVRCTAAGIGRQVLQSYMNKDTIFKDKDVECPDGDVKNRKAKQITFYQGRRHNRQTVHLWSRHLSSFSSCDITTSEAPLYTNVNYSKVEIPMIKKVLPMESNRRYISVRKSDQRVVSTVDTRDWKLRQKAAQGTRTAHCQSLDKKTTEP